MASLRGNLLAARVFSTVRSSFTATRSYATAAKTWLPRNTSGSPSTASKVTQTAKASTSASNGNNGKKNGNSTSAVDADIAEALSTPAESVPSSTVLQQTAAPTSSFASEPAVGSGLDISDTTTDWSKSYSGLSQQPFPKESAQILLAPVDPEDIEMKPDGLIYLPEIKYRRVLNKAFGPGGWGLAPRSETNVGPKIVSREYALVCLGRLVAIARGEQEYFDPHGIPTATEAAKSNALMRCCKDLGIASELWDPRFIREFKSKYCVEVFAEHLPTKKKKKLWRRKDQPKFEYPFKE